MLRTVPVATCLDKHLTVMGFEIPDLFAIFLLLSVLDLLLGDLGNQLVLVWMPSVAFSFFLWISKRGKPDSYLLHWIQFHLKPGTISAFDSAGDWVPYRQMSRRESL